jgi:hypothetical protein
MLDTIAACASWCDSASYWRDASTRSRHNVIYTHKRARLPAFSANLATRAHRESSVSVLIERCRAHKPNHFQIGRAYSCAPRNLACGPRLNKANKAKLDRQGIMNSRVFGL